MNSYRLFVLDNAGRVVDSMPFSTNNDEEACAWGNHVARERRFELWHDKRRVHCSHEGPSVLDSFFDLLSPPPPQSTVYFASGAIRT